MSLDNFKYLKDLLLKPEQEEIQRLQFEVEQLQKRLANKEVLIETLKPILTPLLREKISEQPQEIASALAPIIGESLHHQIEISREKIINALSPIMGQAIKKQVGEAREEIVDALYPVIGQTIRKSISEAMKRLAQTVNDKIDRTLSPVLLVKKVKSRILGIPTEEFLLKDFLPFNIREIFYIHRTSGILLAHVSVQPGASGSEEDLISGMLTAIKDFACTVFSTESEREINSITYDDLQIQIEAGRYAYLAVVTSGVPTPDFNDQIRDLEQDLHQKYHSQLRTFEGDLTSLEGIHIPLRSFINKFSPPEMRLPPDRPSARAYKGLIYLMVLVFLIIALLAAIIYLPGKMRENKIRSQLSAHLQDYPINMVNNFQWNYHDNVLVLSGWVRNLEEKKVVQDYISSQLGIEHIQNKLAVKLSNEDLQALRQHLIESLQHQVKTDLSSLQFFTESDMLWVKGRVESAYEKMLILDKIMEFSESPMLLGDLFTSQDSFEQQEGLKKAIEQSCILFAENDVHISPQNRVVLDSLVKILKLISFENLIISGHSDSIGEEDINLRLSNSRACAVRDYLISKEIDSKKLTVIAQGEKFPVADNKTSQGRSKNRRVTFQFSTGN